MIEVASSAGPQEAAAAIAAVQRFLSESSAAPAGEPYSAWQQAALVEGVKAKGSVQDHKGGVRWLS